MPQLLRKPSLFKPISDDRRADLIACQTMLQHGSRSFFAASRLLPRTVREPACVLYAFCRLADDAIDQERGGANAVAMLREQLDRIYAARPAPVAVERALAQVVEQFGIPRSLFDALIEGFEWDAQGRRYDDLSALEAYAARVAGTVGAMMALLMGVRDAAVLAHACELGIAMQLTNIARDVGEDARNGRVYLPLCWLREAGLDAERWLSAPQFNPAIASVVERLLRRAGQLYARIDAGVAGLPPGCRPGINAARFFYAEIGREVERAGFDSVSRRAIVSTRRKFSLLARSFVALPRPAQDFPATAEPASAFLVTAAMSLVSRELHPASVQEPVLPWWRFRLRLIRLIEMFDRLERVERDARSARMPANLSPRSS